MRHSHCQTNTEAEAVQRIIDARPFGVREYTRAQVTYMVEYGLCYLCHSKATDAHKLDGLDFKVEGNQGKNQTLQGGDTQWESCGCEEKKNLPSSLVRDNRKHEALLDLRCPECRPANRSLRSICTNSSAIHGPIPGNAWHPYFKGDMIVANADLELLLANDVLFWPIRVIFPLCGGDQVYTRYLSTVYALCDFASLHNPFQFLHDQWSNPH